MTILEIRKRFEQPWRWAMYVYWWLLVAWLLISAVRHPTGSVTRLQILALAPAFISMALFGLYTGEIDAFMGGANRDRNPLRFWFVLIACLTVGGLCLIGAAFGPTRH